jgi:hypothetical protein
VDQDQAAMDDAALAARAEMELYAQGLTRAISDPDLLRQIAGLFGATDARARERQLAHARRELAQLDVRIRLDQDIP